MLNILNVPTFEKYRKMIGRLPEWRSFYFVDNHLSVDAADQITFVTYFCRPVKLALQWELFR